MPLFTWFSVSDKIEMFVTSDPVPAVVGKTINGSPFSFTLFSPNKVSKGSLLFP
jgi:hypothetical protein